MKYASSRNNRSLGQSENGLVSYFHLSLSCLGVVAGHPHPLWHFPVRSLHQQADSHRCQLSLLTLSYLESPSPRLNTYTRSFVNIPLSTLRRRYSWCRTPLALSKGIVGTCQKLHSLLPIVDIEQSIPQSIPQSTPRSYSTEFSDCTGKEPRRERLHVSSVSPDRRWSDSSTLLSCASYLP